MRAFKRAMRTLSRWSLAVGLLPLLWVLATKLAAMGGIVAAEGYRSWWLYIAGAVSYLAAERVLTKPMWLYIVGHELTHALSGILSGARIYSLRAGSKGGEVHLSKSNAFIALSPYIVPFYAAVVVVLYAAARRWLKAPPTIEPVFQALLGAALAFHFSLTFSALHRQQSDLKVVGFFLSSVLIAIGNALILALLAVSLFAKTPTLIGFTKETGRETMMIWMKGLGFAKNRAVNRLTPPAANHHPKERTRWTR